MTNSLTNLYHISGYNDNLTLYRSVGGKKSPIDIPFEWFFLIDKVNFTLVKDLLTKLDCKHTMALGPIDSLVKIKMPWKRFRDKNLLTFLSDNHVKVYEANIHPVNKFLLENEVSVVDNFKIAAFDIEVEDKGTTIDLENSRILSYCLYDGTNAIFNANKDERGLLASFFDDISKYDIIMGWNSINYDTQVIRNRCKKNDISHRFYSIIHLDLMDLIKVMGFNYPSMRLDYVARRELGVGKVDLKGVKVHEVYDKDFEKFKEYNISDTKLTFDINTKLNVFDFLLEQCKYCKVFPFNYNISDLLSILILRKAHTKNYYAETKPTFVKEKYQGAFVLEPKIGRFRNVNIFDFTSLYPSVIRSFNISFETKTKDSTQIVSPKSGVYFKKEVGILPEVEKDLLEKRMTYKNQYSKTKDNVSNVKQNAYKILANSVYGLTGSPFSIFYDKDLAESITLAGRECLFFAQKFFDNVDGCRVLAGDTDSVFVNSPEVWSQIDLDKILDTFNIELEKELTSRFNIIKSHINLKYEYTFRSFVNFCKKKYIGVKPEGGKPIVKGVDFFKKDTIKVAGHLQKTLLLDLLTTNKPVDFYIKWMTDLRDRYKTLNFTASMISIHQKMAKAAKDYVSNLTHVRLVKQEGLEDEYFGTDVEYIFTDFKDKVNGAILAKKYTGIFDREYYWTNKIASILIRTLEVVFPDYDWKSFKEYDPNAPKVKRTRRSKIKDEPKS